MSTSAHETSKEKSRRGRSRYDRPRRIVSWTGLWIGLILGAVGGFVITRTLAPAEEVNTVPRQLRAQDKTHYTVAIMVSYAYDGDLNRTIGQLLELGLGGDPIDAVARTACELAGSGYVGSASGERAIRSMMAFYQSQGRSGCADELLPPLTEPTRSGVIVASTPTIPPPPSKTPTPEGQTAPTPTPGQRIVTTVQLQRDFELIRFERICDPDIPGIIEVRVRQRDGDEMPGQTVRVRWDDGESIFLTGLMSERGLDYADFAMETSRSYVVEMPGLSDPSNPMQATPCINENNEESLQSYLVMFVPAAE